MPGRHAVRKSWYWKGATELRKVCAGSYALRSLTCFDFPFSAHLDFLSSETFQYTCEGGPCQSQFTAAHPHPLPGKEVLDKTDSNRRHTTAQSTLLGSQNKVRQGRGSGSRRGPQTSRDSTALGLRQSSGGLGRRTAQWVPASKHRDLNLTPRIHVKRPGVALDTGHTETGGSPVAWLAASLLAELRAGPETTSQKNEILKSGQHPRNDAQGCRPRTQPHIMKVQPIKFYPKLGAFVCSSISLKAFYYIFIMCRCEHVMVCKWRYEDNLWEFVLFL